jgi:hypothetical protein
MLHLWPSYFLDKQKTIPQLVRWIPKFDNVGAGQMWKGFCDNNDGNVGNGQRIHEGNKEERQKRYGELILRFERTIDTLCRPDRVYELNEELLELEGSAKVVIKQGTTTSIWETATYSHAVFSLASSYKADEVPSKKNNWYLGDNQWYVNPLNRRGLSSS